MDLKSVRGIGVRYKQRKRVGRGRGSGHGKTCGRGHKGQRSRAGYSRHPVFEGGRMPLARRLPKRGFSNARFRTRFCAINVDRLNVFEDGQTVDLAALRQKGLARQVGDGVKILGNGDLGKKLTVQAHAFSKSAVAKIEAAGGQIVRLEGLLRHRPTADDQPDQQDA